LAATLAWSDIGLGEVALKRNRPADAAKLFDAAVRAEAEYASTLAARADRLKAEAAAGGSPAPDEQVKTAVAAPDAARRGGREAGKGGRVEETLLPLSPLPLSPSADVERRAAGVRLLLLDCDGVLTDGRITLVEGGDEQKSFHTRDGHGLVLLHRAGLRSGIISGRTSRAVTARARDLGITHVRQGTHNKIVEFAEVLAAAGVSEDAVAFVGDDLTDIPLMR